MLASLLSPHIPNVIVMAGGMGKKQRKQLAEQIASIPSDQARVIVATGRYLGEGYLARNTRQVINAVQRGRTALIESHGQPEVAIIDIVDYHIVRAVMRYYAQPPEIEADAGLPEREVETLSEPQDRYNLVLAHYLVGSISLSRAAELLGLTWLDLRSRFLRLDVPVRTAPADESEAKVDVEVARTWKSAR